MAAFNRVVAALNFGIDYYPDDCNEKDIGALISDYFDRDGNDASEEEQEATSDEGTPLQ